VVVGNVVTGNDRNCHQQRAYRFTAIKSGRWRLFSVATTIANMLNSNLTLVLFTDDAIIPTLDSRLDEWITLAKNFGPDLPLPFLNGRNLVSRFSGKILKLLPPDVRQAIKGNAGMLNVGVHESGRTFCGLRRGRNCQESWVIYTASAGCRPTDEQTSLTARGGGMEWGRREASLCMADDRGQ